MNQSKFIFLDYLIKLDTLNYFYDNIKKNLLLKYYVKSVVKNNYFFLSFFKIYQKVNLLVKKLISKKTI